MQTIKTGVVVALLLAVCYGAFVALNTPEPKIPPELLSEFEWAEDGSGIENMMNIEMPTGDSYVNTNSTPPATSVGTETSEDLMTGLPDLTPGASVPQLPAFGQNSPNSFPSQPPGSLPQNPLGGSMPGFPQVGGLTPNHPPAVQGGPSNPLPSELGTFTAEDGPAVSLPKTGSLSSSQFTDPSKVFGTLASDVQDGSSPMQLPLLNNAPTGGNATLGGTAAQKEMPTLPFATAREQALAAAENGKLREALQQLSPYYDSPELTHVEHEDLVDILDALCREVIYSNRHLAEPAYVATSGETIVSVAEKFQITPELLASINGYGESRAIVPNEKLKVIQGPFRGHVSLNRGEMTIFLGNLYAGRFPISLGKEPSPSEGSFEVSDRRRDRTYYGEGGKVIINADSPLNPYGGYWINLGQELCIHGTPEMASAELKDAGCISLAPLDAADVYNILTQGAEVVITR